MGCSESKSEDLTRPDDVKPKLSSSVPKPKPASGVFSSDVQDKSQTARTFSEVLVHKNHLPVREVYALDQGLELGRGACGTVSVVQKIATGELFAMKTVSLDTLHGGSIDELRREIDVQKSLDHPNIVRLFEYFEDPHQHLIHIIMELCTGGALVSRMKIHRHGYTEDAARKLVSKMLSAVLYCHQHGVVHRDIKLDNFIYEHEGEDSELKLIDFGFAHECVNGVGEGMWEQIGTPSYMAPELWSDHEKEYNSSVDMWAIGVVTFMLLSGKRPFHHHDRERKAMMIKHDKLSFHSQEWDYVSGEARDFISALMQKEPSRRLSASQALSHPWMSRELATSPRGGINPAVLDSLEAFARAQDIKKARTSPSLPQAEMPRRCASSICPGRPWGLDGGALPLRRWLSKSSHSPPRPKSWPSFDQCSSRWTQIAMGRSLLTNSKRRWDTRLILQSNTSRLSSARSTSTRAASSTTQNSSERGSPHGTSLSHQ